MGAPNYNDINDAQFNAKYPWLSEIGTHIGVIDQWIGRDTRQKGFSDFCDVSIVKTIAGDSSAVGAKRTRMRIWSQDGSMSELKNRAQAAMSSALHIEFPLAQVNGEVLKGIHEKAGRNVAGYPIKMEVAVVKTKAKTDFTAIIYSAPTPRDLEGLTLDAEGRVVV